MPIGKRGGAAKGERRGGSKPGSAYKLTRAGRIHAAEGIALTRAARVTPLEVMLGIINRDPNFGDVTERELTCTIAAAPYCHARLAAVAIKEIPDASAERRKSMLAGLNYQQRQAIAGILAAAALPEDGEEVDTPAVVEGTEEPK